MAAVRLCVRQQLSRAPLHWCSVIRVSSMRHCHQRTRRLGRPETDAEESSDVYSGPSLRNRDDIAQHLANNVLHEDDHILALNKPNGLPMNSVKYGQEAGVFGVPGLSVNDVLPILSSQLNTPPLTAVYSQDRLHSGVVVLAKTEKIVQSMKKYFRQTRAQKLFYQKYWAVTLGIPKPADSTEVLQLQRRLIGDHQLSVVPKRSTLRARETGKQISVNCRYKTLSSYTGSHCEAALLEVWPTVVKWDSVLMFLLHKLCAVLGDQVYSSRLKSILGRPVLMDPLTSHPTPQVIPAEIARLVSVSTEHRVPLHMHCAEVCLPIPGAPTLTVSAPPPPFFTHTLHSLSLIPE